jgi:CSLREA domain-containing protein
MSAPSSNLPARGVRATMALVVGFLMLSGPAATTLAEPVQVAAGVAYIVNSTADTPDADVGTPACRDAAGKCTLRAAIMQANFHAGADTISLPSGTYKLTRPGDDDAAILGDLDITDSLTIKGAGSGTTIVDGNGSVTHDRVFQILPGAVDTAIRGLTIRAGRKNVNTFDEGGGLLWQGEGGHLNLQSVVVEHNKANYGGGLFLQFSGSGDSVDLNKLTVRGNLANASAGGLGIDLGGFGNFALRNSHVYSNTAYEAGGLYLQGGQDNSAGYSVRVSSTEVYANHASLSAGFENWGGSTDSPVVLLNSYLHDNSAGNLGGAIGNYGKLVVSSSTLAANHASSRGGALYAFPASNTSLTNVTVSGNTAVDYGGGVYIAVLSTTFATVALTNVTISGNSATTAGGIWQDPTSIASLTNTLIAKGSNGANCNSSLGGLNNLSDDSSCGFGGGSVFADLKLGPLGFHGGLTRTQVPQAGSPAINAGTSSGAPAADQRSISRPQGGALWDVGAVEVCVTKPAAPVLVSPDGTTVSGPRVTLDWTDVPCVQGYSVLLRRGSASGPTVQTATGLSASTFKTAALGKGVTYYWRVTAVGDSGKTTSVWQHFKVK